MKKKNIIAIIILILLTLVAFYMFNSPSKDNAGTADYSTGTLNPNA